jgi:hypothetical protein
MVAAVLSSSLLFSKSGINVDPGMSSGELRKLRKPNVFVRGTDKKGFPTVGSKTRTKMSLLKRNCAGRVSSGSAGATRIYGRKTEYSPRGAPKSDPKNNNNNQPQQSSPTIKTSRYTTLVYQECTRRGETN